MSELGEEYWSERIQMAKRMIYAPTTCFACGGECGVIRMQGGNHSPRRYKESGVVECRDCGNRQSWSYDSADD